MDGAAIVAEARTWLGTPFAHQGRLRGVGVDCAGLIICVGNALGILSYDTADYGPTPDGVTMQRLCDEQMRRVDEAGLGGVILFRIGRHPQHLGFVGEYPGGERSLLHAYAPVGRVVETILDEPWRRRIVASYALPGAA